MFSFDDEAEEYKHEGIKRAIGLTLTCSGSIIQKDTIERLQVVSVNPEQMNINTFEK